MTLTAHDSVYIEDVQVYPDAANRRAKVVVHIANYTADEAVIELSIEASFGNKRSQTHTLTAAQQQFEITYDFGADAPLWDEFTPNLIDMRVSLFSDSATDEKLLQIGLRDIRTQGRTFLVNGRPTMMRGTLDCAVFPLTGYPSTDVKEWQRIFNVAKSYGLNHIRFHSWCPPKAAFIAGDIEGMYLQPEAPIWRGTCPFTEAKPVYPFLNKESERILKAYGNHACFVMFVHGNEPWELDMEWLDTVWVPAMKKRDPRRLICAGAHYPIGKHSDFHLPGVTDGFTLRYHQSFDTPPSTQRTYEEQIQTQNIPCIAHETGQWCVFPNLKEIDKYTGCLQPNNFRIVKDFLRQNHLLEQAEDFLHASGKFQTLIYKESNEAFLRTREMGGYQLLGLNDFPGQGTAMVGVVDVFWENKGYVTPQAFRRFNGSVVPLALMDKFVWTNNETFSADIRIAQYSHSTLHDIATEWELVNNQNEPIASGMFKQQDIPIGNTQTLGKLSIPLSEIKHACQLTLRVKLTGTDYQNHWHLWVYPNVSEQKPPEKIVFSAQRDDAIKALQAGKTVLFAPGPRAFAGNTHGTFAPIFWNKAWFPAQKEHTLGLLCSPNHPALTHFPTDFHADFQWHDLMMQSKPIIMDGLDPNLKPIVQPIDDWNTCRRLGLVFEAKVGKGRLLLTSIDLSNDIQNRPVARQMRRSLMHYMAGEAFSPAHTLSVAQLNALVPKRPLHDLQASISASSSATGHESINVLDTNPSTFWQSHNKETGHGYPHHLILDLNTITAVQALRFLPRQDGASEGWVKTIRLFVSDNKKQWRHVKQAPLSNNQEWKQVDMPVSTRFVKIELVSPHDSNHTSASFAELDIVIRTKK